MSRSATRVLSSWVGVLVMWTLALPAVQAEAPRVSPAVLPEALRQQWNDLRPSFNENSRCAAVWDAGGDAAKQALKCSVYMRMGSEAERRALAACEEFRAEHKIRAACRIVAP
jgi:hypothetical protein